MVELHKRPLKTFKLCTRTIVSTIIRSKYSSIRRRFVKLIFVDHRSTKKYFFRNYFSVENRIFATLRLLELLLPSRVVLKIYATPGAIHAVREFDFFFYITTSPKNRYHKIFTSALCSCSSFIKGSLGLKFEMLR